LGISFSDSQPAVDTIFIENFGRYSFQQPFDVSIVIDRVIHDYVNDLGFNLTHHTVFDTLIYRVEGVGGENFKNTILNEPLGVPFSNSSAPFSGFFQPYNPLSSFLSVPTNGEWILTINDHKQGDDGILEGWSIVISQSTISSIEPEDFKLPVGFSLYQNYPNPFNPSTKIKFTIPSVGTSFMKFVQLKVYDVLGNEVATLVNEELPAGEYEVEFDTKSISSFRLARNLSSGIYFYQLKAENFIETKKMILIK
jgi:subtilisin-like proprotein convertase family protein